MQTSSIFVTITYNENNLEQIGIDSESELEIIEDEIEDLSRPYMDELILKYRNLINNLYTEGIISSNDKIIYKNHLEIYSGIDSNNYVIELRFYSTNAARIFIKYGGQTDGAEISDQLFATKVTERYADLFTSTPNNILETSVTDYYNEGIEETILGNFGGEAKEGFSGVFVSYMFLLENSRVHSNGSVVKTSEGSLHCFDDAEDNIFIFYQITAKPFVWYLLALAITMVFLAISLIVIYFKKTPHSSELLVKNNKSKF
jgi:hypothetical protein